MYLNNEELFMRKVSNLLFPEGDLSSRPEENDSLRVTLSRTSAAMGKLAGIPDFPH